MLLLSSLELLTRLRTPSGLIPPGAGEGEIVYSDLHLGTADATAAPAGHAMDGYASLAPDEVLAASQQQARGARLAEQSGYVDWALVAPASASGSGGAGQTYAAAGSSA